MIHRPIYHFLSFAITANFATSEVFLDNKHSPSCSIPQNSNFNWFSCGLDPESWYGISNSDIYDWTNAVTQCQKAGGELISITDQNIDTCAYYALSRDPNVDLNDFVLYSGKYFWALNQWAWCPTYVPGSDFEDTCLGIDNFNTYDNWINQGDTGDCMGGAIINKGTSFYDYGWMKRSCESVNNLKTRVMCRKSCQNATPDLEKDSFQIYLHGQNIAGYTEMPDDFINNEETRHWLEIYAKENNYKFPVYKSFSWGQGGSSSSSLPGCIFCSGDNHLLFHVMGAMHSETKVTNCVVPSLTGSKYSECIGYGYNGYISQSEMTLCLNPDVGSKDNQGNCQIEFDQLRADYDNWQRWTDGWVAHCSFANSVCDPSTHNVFGIYVKNSLLN